jgi:hypothetical protein
MTIHPMKASLVALSVLVAAISAAACSGGGGSSTPGTGEVTLADVVGTWTIGSTPYARTHVLQTIVDLPAKEPKLDASSDYVATPARQGCRVRRFDAAAPRTDADGGDVTLSGYSYTNTLAAVGTDLQLYTAGSPITCSRDGSSRYACTLTAGANTIPVADAFFPAVALRVIAKSDLHTITTFPSWPYGDAPCILRLIDDPSAPTTQAIVLCEQRPTIAPSQISETLSGGAGYGASNALLGNGADFPGPIGMILDSVKSGATEIGGTDTVTGGVSLSLADGAIAPSAPITVSFTCLQSTPGAGCTGEVAELRLETSPSVKTAFDETATTGEIDCFTPIANTTSSQDYSITVSAPQMAALFAGQTGGSVRLELMNLQTSDKTDGKHPVHFGAGYGLFGFTNE